MSVYEKAFTLLSSDVDARQRLRLSRLFTLLQEAAIAHTTELGMGREKTLDKGLLWILVKQSVRILRLPVYDEAVRLESWPGRTMHLYFPRYYRLFDARGTLLAEVSSLWALMDRNDRHIVFPEEHGIFIDEAAERPALPLPAGFRLPQAEEEHAFTVPYSYTDLNGHMNNTRYLDLAEDIMPPSLRERDITQIRAEYSAEAAEGETLRLAVTAGDGLFALCGNAQERRLFRLLLEYAQP